MSICSTFFSALANNETQMLVDGPIAKWDSKQIGWDIALTDPLVPVLFGEPLIEEHESHIHIGIDIFGAAFFMLSRFEELECKQRDRHDRFPANESMAAKNGFLARPIIDEYVEILWAAMQSLWPNLKRRQREFKTIVSHDVDGPSRYAFSSFGKLLQRMGGDLVKRGNVRSAVMAPWIRLRNSSSLHQQDPANTFDWIMDVSEQHDLQSAFYFICGRTNATMDADYEIEHPAMRDLLRRIHARGHEIGLHPSFDTYRSPESIAAEFDRLRNVCREEGLAQKEWGGRMHYLRWIQPYTLRGWEQAGMDYDSTLTYAECPGFRCGTCHEYPAFDLTERRIMSIRIRPLIAMEGSVMADLYMGLGWGEDALEEFVKLKNACKAMKGNFTLLWHNSEFDLPEKKQLYLDVLNA